jgi:hypothetical protein
MSEFLIFRKNYLTKYFKVIENVDQFVAFLLLQA